MLVFLKQSIYKSVAKKIDLNKRLVIRCCFRDLYSLRKIVFSNIKNTASVNYSGLIQISDRRQLSFESPSPTLGALITNI